MPLDVEYRLEDFEEYFGDAEQVKKTLSECRYCGTKLVHSHVSDYEELIVQEASLCPECGQGNRKLVHRLN